MAPWKQQVTIHKQHTALLQGGYLDKMEDKIFIMLVLGTGLSQSKNKSG